MFYGLITACAKKEFKWIKKQPQTRTHIHLLLLCAERKFKLENCIEMWIVWMKYLLALFFSTINTISIIKLPSFSWLYFISFIFYTFCVWAKSFRSFLKFRDNLSLKLIMKIGALLKCLAFFFFDFFFWFHFRFWFLSFLLSIFLRFYIFLTHQNWLDSLCSSDYLRYMYLKSCEFD